MIMIISIIIIIIIIIIMIIIIIIITSCYSNGYIGDLSGYLVFDTSLDTFWRSVYL